MGLALPHYCRGDNAEDFAWSLADAASHGTRGEEALFFTRAALATAAAGPRAGGEVPSGVERARALVDAYATAAGKSPSNHDPASSPLGHFISMFLVALEAGSWQLCQLLVEQYDRALRRDPSMLQLVAKAREMHGCAGGGGGEGGMPFGGDLFRALLAPPPGAATV
jgi:golgi to ER traffic protein 4